MVFLRVENTMNDGSLGQRTSSTGSLHNGGSYTYGTSGLVRKPSKALISGTREKEKVFLFICQCLGRKKVAMLLLSLLPLLVFIYGSFSVNKESSTLNVRDSIGNRRFQIGKPPSDSTWVGQNSFIWNTVNGSNRNNKPQSPSTVVKGNANSPVHPCHGFAFPPPPPPSMRRPGLRACPVCYLPVKQAIASMPNSPSQSPVLRDLKYVKDENPIKNEPHGGSEFGGYPSLERRSDSFDIKESMNVHCGFVKGHKPGHQSGFDIDEADLIELEKPHDVIVASAIFGNYDVIQKPENISEKAKKKVPFYMFIDEETEAYMKNSSLLDDSRKVGIWRIILVHNTPYSDARRNGKVPKLLLHRIFPNVRYSIWIDGKLQLVIDPYQVLERFLWRQGASFAISRHYTRFNVFKEAEANKAAGKYDNSSIDYQIGFYKNEGLTPYSRAKLPITSDVPEGCVIIKEHMPITNLFTCLWFNEVDRFTSRDQLSFSTVRDKVMAKVNWTVNMFLDCERRNFVIQAYHRGVKPLHRRASAIIHYPPALPSKVRRTPSKKNPSTRRGRGERRPGSKHHRKVATGSRNNTLF